jgi:energy-coupling factor transport system permease protein
MTAAGRVEASRGSGAPYGPAQRAAAPVLLGAMVGSLVAGRFETALGCVAIAALGAAAAGAPRPSGTWVRMTALAALFAIALNLYLTPGRPLPWGLPYAEHTSAEGLRHGMLLALRLIGAALAVHGLRAAWPGERAADAAARLLRPLERLRVPVGETRMVVALALRFAPLLEQEVARIARIQELRAGRPPRHWGERMERHRATAIPALVSSLERAELVALALEARHYRVRPAPATPGASWSWRMAGLAIAGTALLWRR